MKTLSKWFTLVELVVVVSILVIISTIWILSYSQSMYDARNGARIWDMANLKISFKNHKLKNWSYPNPWDYFLITNNWTWIIKQWKINENISSLEIIKPPSDPLIWNNYLYSTTINNLFFQVWMSFENYDNAINPYWYKAYIDWDFQKTSDMVEGLIYATWTTNDVLTLSWYVILNNSTFNLPYDDEWNFYYENKTKSELLAEMWITQPKFYWFQSCKEICDYWYNFWTWNYYITNSSSIVTQTWCTFNVWWTCN